MESFFKITEFFPTFSSQGKLKIFFRFIFRFLNSYMKENSNEKLIVI